MNLNLLEKLNLKYNMTHTSVVSLFTDLTRIEKTSSGRAREATKCALNRVLIPRVSVDIACIVYHLITLG